VLSVLSDLFFNDMFLSVLRFSLDWFLFNLYLIFNYVYCWRDKSYRNVRLYYFNT